MAAISAHPAASHSAPSCLNVSTHSCVENSRDGVGKWWPACSPGSAGGPVCQPGVPPERNPVWQLKRLSRSMAQHTASSHSGRPKPPSASAASAQTPAQGERAAARAGESRPRCCVASDSLLIATPQAPRLPLTRWMGFSCRSAPLLCSANRRACTTTVACWRGHRLDWSPLSKQRSAQQPPDIRGQADTASRSSSWPGSPAAPWPRPAPGRPRRTSSRCRGTRCGTAGPLPGMFVERGGMTSTQRLQPDRQRTPS